MTFEEDLRQQELARKKKEQQQRKHNINTLC